MTRRRLLAAPAGSPQAATSGFITITCQQDGEWDPEIAAMIEYVFPLTEWFTTIVRAWRFNRDTEAIEDISTVGIRCANEGLGG